MNKWVSMLKRQPAVARLSERFAAMPARDRLALSSLGGFFAIIVLVYGIWIPLSEYADEARASYISRTDLLGWMRSTEAQARAISGIKPTANLSGQSLLTLVSRTSQRAGVKATRLQPEGTSEVSVWFDDVDFNQLLVWMEHLRQEGIAVRQISVDRQATAGKVSARIVLRT